MKLDVGTLRVSVLDDLGELQRDRCDPQVPRRIPGLHRNVRAKKNAQDPIIAVAASKACIREHQDELLRRFRDTLLGFGLAVVSVEVALERRAGGLDVHGVARRGEKRGTERGRKAVARKPQP